MTSTRPRRGPGRPAAESALDAKSALLRAAREQFSRRSFAAVTVRSLAAAAGVNPAMVNYHFGGKEGIYEAMVAQTVGPIFAQLEQAAHGAGDLTLHQFLQRYQQILAANPWLPNLVVREVLYSQGPFHDTFIRRFAARAGRALALLVERERTQGLLRADLNSGFSAVSLISLTVFPFIARPLLEESLGLDMDEAFFTALAQHNAELFRHGSAADIAPESES